jgi:hypothetical protein
MDGLLRHWNKPAAEERRVVPEKEICSVMSVWDKEVNYVPDPTHGGQPAPGLLGRLYLYDKDEKLPVEGEGALSVELYDDAVLAGTPPVLKEVWNIDQATMEKPFTKKDMMGPGYTLFLPWGTFRPDVTSIHLRVAYKRQGLPPLYHDSGPMKLDPPTEREKPTPTAESGARCWTP